MTKQNLDSDRLGFVTHFHVTLSFDHESRLWTAETRGGYRTLGKTPRQALDDLMRFTKKKDAR